jgi:hypothetical protein
MSLTNEEIEFINEARDFLENPSFLVRVANLVGKPLEKGLGLIPERVRNKIHVAVEAAMARGLTAVTRTVSSGPAVESGAEFFGADDASRSSGRWHSVAAFGTGAVGGFFGVFSLPLELPLTTAIMLRSIVAIARDFGHDVSDPAVQLECLYVLSLGGASDTAYWASRLAFNDLIRNAAREIEKSSAPVLVRFLAQVASRFELVVSEKVMAEVIPVVGALGGGALNVAFSEHFNSAARFHFGLRALERRYGADAVRAVYGN